MKKYILITIATVALFSTVFISCGDDFIERPVQYSIDSENYFNSKDEYDKALIAAYEMLRSSYKNVLDGEIASDNTIYGGDGSSSEEATRVIDRMTHTSANGELKNIWDWMFAGVQRANYILEFKDKTDFEGKEQIIGEARFLRAYYHFELVKWFGGIPLKGDKRFAPGDETSIPRSSAIEVYASIEADLIYASENLSATASQPGRATSGAALALLGKAYLYESQYSGNEKWAQAAAAFQSVIDGNKYKLVDYKTIFEISGENGLESVYEVQYSDVSGEGASFDCLQCSRGNVAVGYNGPRDYKGPFYESGYSQNVPTQECVNIFDPGDKRKDVTILDPIAIGATYSPGNENTGFFNRKYIPRIGDKNLGDLNLTNPNNYRAIRYADVLLMAAEAYSKLGNDTKAKEYLNLVRDRAFGDTNHRITATGPALYDFILAERRLEFVGEGLRFFDLVRTGQAASKITGFTAGKNEVFPIPIEEIQFSGGNWKQNPIY